RITGYPLPEPHFREMGPPPRRWLMVECSSPADWLLLHNSAYTVGGDLQSEHKQLDCRCVDGHKPCRSYSNFAARWPRFGYRWVSKFTFWRLHHAIHHRNL